MNLSHLHVVLPQRLRQASQEKSFVKMRKMFAARIACPLVCFAVTTVTAATTPDSNISDLQIGVQGFRTETRAIGPEVEIFPSARA